MRAFGSLDTANRSDRLAKHVIVKKQNRLQGLILSRRADLALRRKMREERCDLRLAHRPRMPSLVIENETANPRAIRALGSRAVMSRPQSVAHAFEQAKRTIGCRMRAQMGERNSGMGFQGHTLTLMVKRLRRRIAYHRMK